MGGREDRSTERRDRILDGGGGGLTAVRPSRAHAIRLHLVMAPVFPW